jgi:hypothetical protein
LEAWVFPSGKTDFLSAGKNGSPCAAQSRRTLSHWSDLDSALEAWFFPSGKTDFLSAGKKREPLRCPVLANLCHAGPTLTPAGGFGCAFFLCNPW